MATATIGVSFMIKVNTGTVASPVWTTVAGQRNGSLKLSTKEADLTTKDSEGWHEGMPSIKTWGIDFDGLLVEDDAGMAKLETCWIGNIQVQVRAQTPAGHTYTGLSNISDLEYTGPYDAEMPIKGSLAGTGALVKV